MTAQELKDKLTEEDIRLLLTRDMGAIISYEDDDMWISNTVCHHGNKPKILHQRR